MRISFMIEVTFSHPRVTERNTGGSHTPAPSRARKSGGHVPLGFHPGAQGNVIAHPETQGKEIAFGPKPASTQSEQIASDRRRKGRGHRHDR